MGISTSVRKQLFATTILVAAGSIYGGYGRRAMAGSCTTTDVAPAHLNISCSGAANAATDVTQSFTSAGGFTIVDVPMFGLDTTTSGGYGITTFGGTTTITLTGDIHADEHGIYAEVYGVGATTTITNSGMITSDNSYGIEVFTENDTGNVTIKNEADATIQAKYGGIRANVFGEDAITMITNSGMITSDEREGIHAYADADTGNVTISNAEDAMIQSQYSGITAYVEGEDAVTMITNSGEITSDNSYGIYVNTDDDTGNVTIINEAGATIQAKYSGIQADVEGEDAVTMITNSGMITSDEREGIEVDADDDTGNVTISNAATGVIQADYAGIFADVYGEDAITMITNSGEITSDEGNGIYARTDGDTGNVTISNAATGVIQADYAGIYAEVDGEDAVTMITNSGEITSDNRYGIYVKTDGDTGDVTINNVVDATIQADGDGIFADVQGEDAITMITNSGMITSDEDDGIRARTDDYTGNVTISNAADATIQANGNGITAYVYGEDAVTMITNSGEITSDEGNGIYARTDGDTGNVTISNAVTGVIQADGTGIRANVNGEDAITMITNSGEITSDNRYGIEVFTDDDTGNVTISNAATGVIQADDDGIRADVEGENAVTMITNSGMITSDTQRGIDVDADGDTGNVTISNAATGVIQANLTGIYADVQGEYAETEITNSGEITSDTRFGIYAQTDDDTGNVTISNAATGVIQADRDGILANVAGKDAITMITNSGEITSDNNIGILAITDDDTGDVTISNEADATIQAETNGITARVFGEDAITMITNSGMITSDTQRGIYVNTYGDTGNVTISNAATGVIQAKFTGIRTNVGGEGAITMITNSGEITSDSYFGIAVNADTGTGNVTITNEADAIIQAKQVGIFTRVQGEDAVTMITNSGMITSDNSAGSYGIYVNADGDTGNVTINNEADATIKAYRDGIFARVNGEDAVTMITNSGMITSYDRNGIAVNADDDTGNVTIKNETGATIQADGTGIFAYVNNSATTTITSSGTINSDNGDGIKFYSLSSAQTATVNINVNETITASAGAGVNLYTHFNDPDLTATVTIDADINADTGVAIGIGDMSEVAVNIKSGASVIGTSMGIEDGASYSGGISAKTTVTLEGELGGNVDLAGNDDSFTMKGPGASLTAATTLIDGGAGMDDFNFDNVQMAAMSTFTTALDNFELIELKNGSFIRVDGQTWSADDVKINGGNTLEALGASTIMGALENNGTISLADGAVDDVFTVDGNLSGSGTFVLDANLDASETSDQVVITGNVAGSHSLSINNLSGGGVDTGMGDTDGIQVVDVGGTATAASFALASGPVNSGAYVYDLHMSAGNDFYLQSMEGMMSSSAALVPSLARGSTLGADALMVGYLIRKGSRLEAPINLEPQDDNRDDDGDGSSFGADILHASEVDPANTYWLRLLGAHGEYEGRIDVAGMSQVTETDSDFGGVQLGIDFAMPYYPHTYASLWGHYLYQENDVYNKTQAADAGSSTIRSYGAGLGIIYDPGTGLYFDALGSVSFSSADLKDAAGISGDTRGNEYFASAEMGYRMDSGFGNLAFIPQAQIKTHYADFASYTDSSGLRVSNLDSHRSTLRLGMSVEDTYQMSNGNLRLVGGVSWSDVFSSETRADLAAVQVDLSDADQFIEGNLGFQFSMDNGSSIWGSVNHKSGLDSLDSENTSFDLGFSVKF